MVHLSGPVGTAGVCEGSDSSEVDLIRVEAATSSGGHVIDRDRGLSSSVVSPLTCNRSLLIPDGPSEPDQPVCGAGAR